MCGCTASDKCFVCESCRCMFCVCVSAGIQSENVSRQNNYPAEEAKDACFFNEIGSDGSHLLCRGRIHTFIACELVQQLFKSSNWLRMMWLLFVGQKNSIIKIGIFFCNYKFGGCFLDEQKIRFHLKATWVLKAFRHLCPVFVLLYPTYTFLQSINLKWLTPLPSNIWDLLPNFISLLFREDNILWQNIDSHKSGDGYVKEIHKNWLFHFFLTKDIFTSWKL